jgi:ABC-type Zn2+ transport system substrate-binding protein/surface adhesin
MLQIVTHTHKHTHTQTHTYTHTHIHIHTHTHTTHTHTHTHTHTYNLQLQSTPHINKGLCNLPIQSLIFIAEVRNIWNANCKINTL